MWDCLVMEGWFACPNGPVFFLHQMPFPCLFKTSILWSPEHSVSLGKPAEILAGLLEISWPRLSPPSTDGVPPPIRPNTERWSWLVFVLVTPCSHTGSLCHALTLLAVPAVTSLSRRCTFLSTAPDMLHSADLCFLPCYLTIPPGVSLLFSLIIQL